MQLVSSSDVAREACQPLEEVLANVSAIICTCQPPCLDMPFTCDVAEMLLLRLQEQPASKLVAKTQSVLFKMKKIDVVKALSNNSGLIKVLSRHNDTNNTRVLAKCSTIVNDGVPMVITPNEKLKCPSLIEHGIPFVAQTLSSLAGEMPQPESETSSNVLASVASPNGKATLPMKVARMNNTMKNRLLTSKFLQKSNLNTKSVVKSLACTDAACIVEVAKESVTKALDSTFVAEQTIAMMLHARLNCKNVEGVQCFTKSVLGMQMFAFTKLINASCKTNLGLEWNVFQATIDGCHVDVSHNQVQQLVSQELQHVDTADLFKTDVALSGNHSGGFHCMTIHLPLWHTTNGHSVWISLKVASVECGKDNADVLEIVSPMINQSITGEHAFTVWGLDGKPSTVDGHPVGVATAVKVNVHLCGDLG